MSNPPPNRVKNLTLAAVAAQSGCFTLVIVIGALLIGLALDAHFGQKGPFTIGLLLLSIPFSLFLMVRVALSAVKMIQPPPATNKTKPKNSAQTKEE
ncbi:MAG: AtpZ/AtpI family protein [Anaerolineae bacterium]|nr:AtpZ/AtpI family protein [Anaerolineae bacterium]